MECLTVRHYSAVHTFVSIVIIAPIPKYLHLIYGSLMRPNWPKLANLVQKIWHVMRFKFVNMFIALIGQSFQSLFITIFD